MLLQAKKLYYNHPHHPTICPVNMYNFMLNTAQFTSTDIQVQSKMYFDFEFFFHDSLITITFKTIDEHSETMSKQTGKKNTLNQLKK